MPDEDCPGLAMSRAFGDFCLKDYGVISVPDVFYRKITKQDLFVVLATDGVSLSESRFLMLDVQAIRTIWCLQSWEFQFLKYLET